MRETLVRPDFQRITFQHDAQYDRLTVVYQIRISQLLPADLKRHMSILLAAL
jgi:hypothetical protein